MKIVVSKSFYPLFENKARYLVLVGGRGSGKSEFAARKLFVRCLKEGHHRFLILRKVRARIAESAWEVMRRLLKENEVPFTENITRRIVEFAGNEILMDGLDDPEKIKSIKGLTGIWIEEGTEFTERDFTDVDLCLREPGPAYHQIILSFNPDEARAGWLKERFFFSSVIKTGPGRDPDSYIHHSMLEDNPIAEVRNRYRGVLDKLRGQNEALYKIYRLGEWATVQGLIYPYWDVCPLPEGMHWDSIIYGLDYGYSVDPSVLLKIYRKADEYWLQQLIYETRLTNQALAAKTKSHPQFEAEMAVIYADSSEPKSIEELCREGLVVKPAIKGADSVRSGIDFLRSRKIHITPDSPDVIAEQKKYAYKEDKDGRTLPIPVDFDNNAMDAARYGIVTDYYEGMGDIDFIVL